jgi:hypothetical protein
MGVERRLAKLPANSLHRTHLDTSIEIEDPTHAITLASADSTSTLSRCI